MPWATPAEILTGCAEDAVNNRVATAFDLRLAAARAFSRAASAPLVGGNRVRLLVPGSGSDSALVQRLTRGRYPRLQEGGVPVFEWNAR